MRKIFFVFVVCCLLSTVYSFSQGTWTQKASYPSTQYRISNFAFTINGKGYHGTGWDGLNIFSDFWEYDPVANAWTQKANFGGGQMYFGTGMAIGNKGYAGLGMICSTFWEYDPVANSWTQKAPLPGGARNRVVTFSNGTKGYAGTGALVSNNTYLQDLYEYDPVANSWTAKAPFSPGTRGDIDHVSFVINNKAYLGMGAVTQNSPNPLKDWWEYDIGANAWTQKANFPGATGRLGASGFAICNKGYAGLGADATTAYADWYQYDPVANTWSPCTNYPGGIRADAPTFVIGNSGYVVDGAFTTSGLWEFKNGGTLTLSASATTVCQGSSVTLNASGGNYYSWSTGATISSIVVTPSSTTAYSAEDTTSACGGISTITITVGPPPTATISSNTTICQGETTTISASGGVNYSWNTGATTASITAAPTATVTYSVIVSMGTCTATASTLVTVTPSLPPSISGNTILCAGDIATLTASGGNNYSWNTGATTVAVTVAPAVTTTYTVTSSNSNGCSASAAITVTVSPPPVANATSATICSGQTATLTASGGNNYSWSSGSTTSSISLTLTSSSTYSVIVSIGSCTDTASASVSVTPAPTATAFSSLSITQGQSTTLGASGGGNYLWSNGDTSANITVSPAVTTVYCVTVTNASGCTDSSCVIVTVIIDSLDCSFATTGELSIPNAFSPNGDLQNDAVKLLYGNYSCIKTYSFVIYNRWGEKVFESQNPLDKWDGTFQGKLEDSSVFAWYIKAELLNGEKIEKKGNISLLR